MTVYFKDFKVQIVKSGAWAPVSIAQFINEIKSMESSDSNTR
jgi:hypothetical protein